MEKALLSSLSSEWRTPLKLFNQLDAEFNFGLDAAADDSNRLCLHYFTKENDALTQTWAGYGNVFVNPPYGRELARFIQKGYEEWRNQAVTSVFLIPARPDTRVWQEIILPYAEVVFLKGRLKFGQPNNLKAKEAQAPFPSAVVVFHGWKALLD